jgi:hypothetical protein
MTESSEVRASHEEVEQFVGKLREFHGSLEESERTMLGTILEGAQSTDTGGYGMRTPRYGGAEGLNDLVGWIEEPGEEDTQGFLIKAKV